MLQLDLFEKNELDLFLKQLHLVDAKMENLRKLFFAYWSEYQREIKQLKENSKSENK